MTQAQSTKSPLEEYRIERYLEMGFSQRRAVLLAGTRGHDGFPLDHRKVKEAIDKGCSHTQAIKIFA